MGCHTVVERTLLKYYSCRETTPISLFKSCFIIDWLYNDFYAQFFISGPDYIVYMINITLINIALSLHD